jgi:RIO kinase 2
MKLDPTALRYLSRDDFRVLTAVEMGMKNHDMVPRELITQIASLRHGGSEKILHTLLRHKLLHHESKGFDGYRLTTLGYDYLALRAFSAKGVMSGVGTKIGVGKESDIYLVEDEEGREMVLKLHRLGRTSFRKIKTKRDYHGRRGHPSWIYLSRLASQKEYAYMKALYNAGFPVPEPIEANRHCVLMSLLTGWPLHSITDMPEPEKCMQVLLDLIVRLGKSGVIHGDFNEFNVAVDKEDSSKVVMYDFPQMVSMNHLNAKMYFDRDVEGLFRFFQLRFGVDVSQFERPAFEEVFAAREGDIDVQVGASGFSKEETNDFEAEMERMRNDIRRAEGDPSSDDDSGSEEDEEEVPSDQAKPDEHAATTDCEVAEPIEKGDEKEGSGSDSEEEEAEAEQRKLSKAEKEERRKERVQREVAKLMRKQLRSGKTSRNTIKSREKRKIKESMNQDW